MKVSLRWLADYIDLPTKDAGELKYVLDLIGHKVENVDFLHAAWTDVYVAQVEEIRPHPNADKVRLCKVSTGRDQIDVVCGAWNFEAGAKVAFAVPGARLPGGMEIGRRQIRGIESAGMILSERELDLGDDHAGILVLDADAPVGVDFTELVALPDVVFDLEITPNRPDAMSMVGIARDLGAYYDIPYTLPPMDPPTSGEAPRVRVRIEDPTGCYRFVARELRGATIAPSPFWMRQRLRAAGVRPISNVVDVTNYVMLELGQPLHAFDLDKVTDESIVVRRAQPGERLVTLDGVDRTLVPDDLVVADAVRASGLAGTMGGEESEVSATTKRVLIEAAAWDPPTIMYMSRRHGLLSEASRRFERGVDPNLPPDAASRAARLMVELTGGTTPTAFVDEVAKVVEPAHIELRLSEVTRILGDVVPTAEVAPLLKRLRFDVAGSDPLAVTVPTYRPDLTRPVDLVEEVARLFGLDRFPEKVPTGPGGGWTVEQRRHRVVRRILTGAGLTQAVNLAFLGLEDLDAFAYPTDHEGRLTISVKNPLNDELSSLRTSLVPGLLRSLRYNGARALTDVALFEIGRVFHHRHWPEDSRVPDQPERLAFAVTGAFGPRGFEDSARPADVHTATALWRLLAKGMRLDFELRPGVHPGFHPGRTADVYVEGQHIGHVGEIHPVTAAAYDLEGRVAAGELNISPIIAPLPDWQIVEPSGYPPVAFDLAFEVDDEVPAAALLRATVAPHAAQLEDARVFDEYRGANLPPGRKSLAISYVFRAPDHTLTTDEAAALRNDLIAAAQSVGATLRGA
jgi:phenylalanyl-tRNA synthetase beta chain